MSEREAEAREAQETFDGNVDRAHEKLDRDPDARVALDLGADIDVDTAMPLPEPGGEFIEVPEGEPRVLGRVYLPMPMSQFCTILNGFAAAFPDASASGDDEAPVDGGMVRVMVIRSRR